MGGFHFWEILNNSYRLPLQKKKRKVRDEEKKLQVAAEKKKKSSLLNWVESDPTRNLLLAFLACSSAI